MKEQQQIEKWYIKSVNKFLMIHSGEWREWSSKLRRD